MRIGMIDRQAIRKRWETVGSKLDERGRRVFRRWLERMGRRRYPQARELTITADCGGSNGTRVRLWKIELQRFADETGLALNVHHYPPGASKWNRIEHRLFRHITQNWRGRPLTDRLAVVELIGATTTTAGLKVARHAQLSKGRQGQRRPDEAPRHHRRSVPP